MSLHEIGPGVGLAGERGRAVVVIPLYGAHDLFARCLHSVLAHTPEDVAILVADDASPDPASLALARELDAKGALRHDVHWLRQPENQGFVGNCNTAFAVTAPADVVLVNSDVVVAEGWFDGLRDAAHSDSTIATATALTNHGTIVSVPYRNRPRPMLPQDRTLDELAATVRERSLRLRPRLPVAIGHCVYVRRAALDLVGPFDLAFAPGYGEEVDFSQRCLLAGLQHVAADDVLVLHQGGASFSSDGERNPIQDEHEQLVAARYPYYHRAVAEVSEDRSSTLARALAIANQAVRGRRVTVDARSLGPFLTGTQIHTLELIGALARTGEVRVRAVVPDDLGDYAREALDALPRVERLSVTDVEDGVEPDEVVHRPWQINDPGDLPLLGKLGDRLVVTHQDLIAYRNPAYHADARAWLKYRATTAEALAWASVVVFFSQHAADDALAEDLLPPSRARTVLLGVDHQLVRLDPEPQRPAGVPDDLDARPYLLCLGTDFRHKNRPFALRFLAALRERHGWQGRLVLAGPTVAHGSSAGEEAEILAADPELARHVVHLAAVSEAEKAWLYGNATAVVYPTTYEGFGLVPFEVADAGVPCLFARQASIPEVLPGATAALVPWDAAASADACIDVLEDPERAKALVAEVREAAARLTWDATAAGLLEAYDDAVRLPARDVAKHEGNELGVDARYWALRERIGGTGMSLVDPDEPLLDEPAQRALAALARRPQTRGVLLRALHAVHRVGDRAGDAAAARTQRDDEDEL
ncbi:MAG: glycosyltransferase [Solirubrobacterales bacterium]|nr:glycosyltransferase [Solirubrobacterales bacterium]